MRVALIGWGAIGRTVGRLLSASDVEIVAVGVRDTSVERSDLPSGAALMSDPGELAAHEPDVVAEAAGRESVVPWGTAALEAGTDLIVSSVSAFADPEILASLRALAAASGAHIQVQPGALAGVDALAAARLLGIDEVEHRIVKPPTAWAGTPAADTHDLDELTDAVDLFVGTAAETASTYPKNANVAMTTALAGIGPEATQVRLVADPAATTNRHELRAHGAFGSMELTIANNPLPDNPKTSAMAALALTRAIENRVSALVI